MTPHGLTNAARRRLGAGLHALADLVTPKTRLADGIHYLTLTLGDGTELTEPVEIVGGTNPAPITFALPADADVTGAMIDGRFINLDLPSRADRAANDPDFAAFLGAMLTRMAPPAPCPNCGSDDVRCDPGPPHRHVCNLCGHIED